MTLKITKNNYHWFIIYISIGFLLMGITASSNAQEMLGVTLSDYNGISSTMLNPALMTGSRSYLDINVVSGNIFFENSIYYLPTSFNTFPKFVNGKYNLYEGQFKYGRSFNYYDNTDEKYMVANVKLMGPSVMIQSGKHAFGFTTTVRTAQAGNKIPYELPVISYEEISFEEIQRIEFDDYNVNFTGMIWGEIGLSYAYDLIDYRDNRLTIGANVKVLLGSQGAYVDARNINYIIVDSKTLNIINLDADFGYALPLDSETNQINFNPLIRGFGFGADLGIVYTKKRSAINYGGERLICAKPYHDYYFKIGASLLDFGSVSFKNGSELHRFDNVGYYWEQFDTVQFSDTKHILQDMSTVFYGDPDSSFVNNKVSIGLPTAFSLLIDYHFNNNIYLGFTWIQPLKILKNTIWHPAQLALIPRYEKRYFGISLPVSYFNYYKLRIGMSIRIYTLTIGTDNLGSWFGVNDFTGSDIYFSFKFNLGKGRCLSSRKGACDNQDFGNRRK